MVFVYKKPSKWGKFDGPSFTILADLRCLYIPCAFVTHFGKCIDEKTPLLRSMDAVTLSGLRLLKAIGIATDAKAIGRKQSGNPDRESGEVSRETLGGYRFFGDVGWKAFESRQKLLYGCQPASNKNYIIVVMIEVGYQTLDKPWFPFPSLDLQAMCSYLGWEQEFFVMPADLYKARPDLVNCGRTLFGKLPTRHQQGDLNYFQPVPGKVQENPVGLL